MALSTELISQFAKIVAPKESRPEFTTVTGRAKSYAGKMYVQIDGSDQLTPIASSTVGLKDNDWVTVQIKNHSATVTGNATDPSAGKSYADDIKDQVDDVVDQISEFEIVIADKVSTTEFDAQVGRIDQLTSDNVNIKERLTATEADIGTLEANKADITDLNAINATIENLDATKIDVDIADAKYATITNLEATNADIHNLEADYGSFKQLTTDNFTAVTGDIDDLKATKLNVEDAKILYANIDFANIGEAAIENFFSKSGMIEDLVVSSGTITGHLVGVTISGDLIEGNTIKADKLVVLGEDGLYYKLNVGAETVAAQQTDYNSLNGSIITANTITAEKINVDDLVAFNATIGGFKIGSDSIYSGVKSSVDNSTAGVYMDDTGQFALGDTNNYLKYFKDVDGNWKLALSAQTITLGTSDKPLEETISDIQTELDDVGAPSVGARNLLLLSNTPALGAANPLHIWDLSLAPEVGETYTFSTKATLDSSLQKFQLYDGTGAVLLSDLEADGSIFKGTFEWPSSLTYDDTPENLWKDTTGISGSSTGDALTASTSSTGITSITWTAAAATLTSIEDENTTDAFGFEVGKEYEFSVEVDNSGFDFSLMLEIVHLDTTTEHVQIGSIEIDPSTGEIVEDSSHVMFSTTFSISSTISHVNTALYLQSETTGAASLSVNLSEVAATPSLALYGYPSGDTATANILEWAKFERGTVNTDWTPAPEDLENDISDAQNTANNAQNTVVGFDDRINSAQLTIDSINAQLQSLVVGEDGETLMEQTETGFRFNFSVFQEQIQNALDGVTDIQGELDDVDSAVGSIQSSVSYLNELNSYITMSSEEGTPYIELGQQDGEFKVQITNTEMAFMQGTQKIAYLTNHQLYIQSSVVTDELQIGEGTGYIWRKRSNKHLGLRYVTA